MIIRIVVLVIIILVSQNVIGQECLDSVPANQIECSIFKRTDLFIVEAYKSGIGVVASPFQKWDNTKIYNTVLLFGSASFSYFFLDNMCKESIDKNIPDYGIKLGESLSELGHPIFVGSSVIGVGALGLISQNNRLSRAAYLSAQSFVVSMTLCYTTKYLSGRVRPNYTDNNELWYGFNWGENHKRSFFSGHTAALFSVTTVFALEYNDITWIPPILYLFAGTISVLRIFAEDHWASDVIFAAGISHLVAKKIAIRKPQLNKKYSAVPFFSGRSAGLILKF